MAFEAGDAEETPLEVGIFFDAGNFEGGGGAEVFDVFGVEAVVSIGVLLGEEGVARGEAVDALRVRWNPVRGRSASGFSFAVEATSRSK